MNQAILGERNSPHYTIFKSDTQKLLKIAQSWVQNQSGWHKSILDDTTTPLPHVESCWIPSLRTNLGEYNLKPDLDYTGVYSLQQLNNCHIMTIAIKSNDFTSIEIKKINNCREYLGLTTLLDITLADGCILDPHMRSGNVPLFSSTTKLLKAKQQCPHCTGWKLWIRCSKLFADHNQLRVPLTQWLCPTSELKCHWP
eukprot:7121539-Ditylum_brightwellii.AAC.1